MPLLIYVLGWLCNIAANFLFGIVFVPLAAFLFSPWLGVIVTLLLITAIPIAKRMLHRQTWRREYGWSLLMPGVGLWLRGRLVREDRAAAALSWRLACCGGIAMVLLSSVVWNLNVREFTSEFQCASLSDAQAARYMERYLGGQPLEKLHANRLFRALPPERQQRLDRAWKMEHERLWGDRFRAHPAIVSREQAMITFGYDRLAPDEQNAFSRAWIKLHPPANSHRALFRP